MSMISLSVTCINPDCEKEIDFEAEADPGDPGNRECPPSEAYIMAHEVICPACKADCSEAAQVVADNYEDPSEPDYEPDFDDIET
jgi:hypothetical protein